MIPDTPAGRFAPSPTGDLHFGSLLAAMASYCEARSKKLEWQLRIDDIDGPRSVPGAADSIQKTLIHYGLTWDGPIRWQSAQHLRYRHALATLIDDGLVFSCSCSRRSLPPGKVYPGTCRHNRLTSIDEPVVDKALRIVMPETLEFDDAVQGTQRVDVAATVGDIIIWRRDKLVSYTLACAVDDATDCTEVVRGADLLQSTAAQIAIMRYLSLPAPRYAHIPVAVDKNDDKLSKHSKAATLDSLDPLNTLQRAWHFLGQKGFETRTINDFWLQATDHWQISQVPAALRMAELQT